MYHSTQSKVTATLATLIVLACVSACKHPGIPPSEGSAVALPAEISALSGSNSNALISLSIEGMKFCQKLQEYQAEPWLVQTYLGSLKSVIYNIANFQTAGFKRCSIPFHEIMGFTDRARFSSSLPNANPASIVEFWNPVSRPRDLSQGPHMVTGERMDIAIKGEGFLEIQCDDGSRAFTRSGQLIVAEDGRVATLEGLAVVSMYQPIPAGTTSLTISPLGEVTAYTEGSKSTFRMTLSRFQRPEALKPIAPNLFMATDESGVPEVNSPGENGCGLIYQGFLERSNVSIEHELLELLEIERLCLARVYKPQTSH